MDHKLVKPPMTAATESANSNPQRTRRRRAHSFSSSLLESICQSMDEDDHHSSRRSQYVDDVQSGKVVSSHSHLNLHRQLNIKVSKQNRAETVVLQAAAEKVTKSIQNHRVQVPSFSSSSNFSYSDSSSSHGRLSSAVSSYGPDSADSSSSSCFSTCSNKSQTNSIKQKITKAKLRAVKLYTELKNPKKTKPESPPPPPSSRCRLVTYLNSIFTPKKQSKTEHPIPTNPPTTSITKPKPKPPPISNDRKASVSATMKTTRHDQRDEVKGREIFKKCQEKIVRGLKMREFVEELGGGDDDDDAESYASSDLFELEFLMERGGEELPVFETTDIKINQAIANGFSL